MKNWFSKYLAETTEEGRTIVRIALIFMGGVMLSLPLVIYQVLQSGGWQLYLVLATLTAWIALLSFSVTLARQNRVNQAMTLVIGGVCVLLPGLSALISGLGLILGITEVLIILIIAGQTASSTRAKVFAVIAGIVSGAFTLLIDLFAAWERVSYPILQNSGPFIAVAIVLALGAYFIRRFREFSLRTKLISAFLVVTIVPLAIISYINSLNTSQALVQAADVKIAGAAQVTADQVDAFFASTLTEVRTKAQDPVIINYLLLPETQRTGSLEAEQLSKLLVSFASEYPNDINSIGVIDRNGLSLADTSPSEVGVSKADRSYFQQAIKTGTVYSSEVIFSATTGKPSLYFTAPVRNPATNEIVGVFRIRYTADVLQHILEKNAGLAGADSLPVLLDENHIRLAHGELPGLAYKTIVPLSADALAKLQANNSLPKGTAEQLSTNLPEFEAGLNNVAKSPFFIAELHEEGQGTEESTVVKLKTHPWIMVFGQTNTVFLAPIQAQTRNSLLIAFILALAAAVLGFFVAQTLSGPIVRLTEVAEQIAAGNTALQAKVETGDEIGILAGTFNTMTAQLRDFITSLEQRVSARTQDLATVAEVGTATATILNVDQLLQQVVDLTKDRFNLYHSHIYLLDESGENLVLASGADEAGRQMVAEGRSIPLDREQSLVARAAREQKGVTVNDVTQAPDFLPNPLLPDTRSELAVPMIVGGRVIGVFDVQSDVVGRFGESDINIQTTLAAQVATSIQNVRQFEQSKTQADFEALVNTIGQKIQRATTMEDTLQTAIRELGLALGATRVSANIQASRQTDGQDASRN